MPKLAVKLTKFKIDINIRQYFIRQAATKNTISNQVVADSVSQNGNNAPSEKTVFDETNMNINNDESPETLSRVSPEESQNPENNQENADNLEISENKPLDGDTNGFPVSNDDKPGDIKPDGKKSHKNVIF